MYFIWCPQHLFTCFSAYLFWHGIIYHIIFFIFRKDCNKDCDKTNVNKIKKDAHSSGKNKKSSASSVNKPAVDIPCYSTVDNINIKTEPLDDYETPVNEIEQAVANIELFRSNDSFGDFKTPVDFGFIHQPQEFDSYTSVNDAELQQAVANIDFTPTTKVEKPVVKVSEKENSSKSKKRHSVKVKPKIKIEEEDYFSVKQEVHQQDYSEVKIKLEPITSPHRSVESPVHTKNKNWSAIAASGNEHDIDRIDAGPTRSK